MRDLVKILAILLGTVLLTNSAQAQKTSTATMRVTVTVLSGATLTDVTPLELDFEKNEIKGGDFSFTAPMNAAADVSVTENVLLKNEFGEEISLKSDSLHKVEDNLHKVNVGVDLSQTEALNGHYEGTIVTTVYYL